MLLSFVIPCYHSSATLPGVVHEIEETVTADGRYDYEIILVNDNPPDDTWRTIQSLCAENERVRGACMSRNFGQHPALMAGYRLAKGEIVVSLDDDGQNPPREMFRLIDALDEETDLAYAIYQKKKHAAWRNWGSKLNDWTACWLIGKPKGLYLASYNAAKRFVVDEIIRYQGPYPYVDGLAIRSTSRVRNVPVDHMPREEGRSGYSMGKLVSVWLNCFTSFSVKPLRLAAFAGLFFAMLGFVMAVVVIVQKLVLGDVGSVGWSSLMCVLLVVGGLIMALLGILGEYLGRLYLSVSAAPQYIVHERCNLPPEDAP